MVITATELKANIGHYLNAVSEDDEADYVNSPVPAISPAQFLRQFAEAEDAQ